MEYNDRELPNIGLDSVTTAGATNSERKPSTFNTKNYLDTKVPDGADSKTITIRLLPIDLKTGNPFVFVHTHNVQVPESIVEPGKKPFKTYICLHKNDIDHEKYGNKCPFCELNNKYYKLYEKETDPTEKKEYSKKSLSYASYTSVICRVIERGKEDEGVKFWKFGLRKDRTDPFNQILKLRDLRKEAAERKGKTENILDIYNGRDLNVTFSKEGTAAPTIVDDSEKSPLSEDMEQMKAWIYDEKKWTDVFPCKPYEYLALIAEMKTPWFDRAQGKWIDKAEYDANRTAATGAYDKAVEMAERAAYGEMNAASSAPVQPTTAAPQQEDITDSLMLKDDDDLPF